MEVTRLEIQGTATHNIPRQVLYISQVLHVPAPLLLVAYKIITPTQEYGTKLKAIEDTLELTNTKYFQTESESTLQIKDLPLETAVCLTIHARKGSILD